MVAGLDKNQNSAEPVRVKRDKELKRERFFLFLNFAFRRKNSAFKRKSDFKVFYSTTDSIWFS